MRVFLCSSLLLLLWPPLDAQTLYWIDAGDLVQHQVASGTTTVLPSASPLVTLSVDVAVEKIFYFREPFSLMSADLDGGNAANITSYPFGFQALAANPVDQRLYWINAFNGQLVSIGYDGSSPTAVGGMFATSGIGIDGIAEKLYFTLDTPGRLTRRNFDATGEEVIVAGGLSMPRDCRYDPMGLKVYWINAAGAVQRCDNDGSGIEVIVAGTTISGITNLVIDEFDESVFVSTSTGSVWRTDLDGSNLEQIYTGGTNISELAITPAVVCSPAFIRGDANDDGSFDIGDPIAVLALLFVPGTASLPCQDAGDANDDGLLNIADAVSALASLFSPGAPLPPPPHPDCGGDPTTDALGCDNSSGCPCL